MLIKTFLIMTVGLGFAKTATTYPSIQRVKGDIYSLKETISVENKIPVKKEQSVRLGPKSKLTDRALLQVHSGGQILIRLNAGSQVLIEEGSVIEFPSIHWQQGVMGEIRIREGKIHYVCEKNCDLKISTPLTETVFPDGDYLISYEKRDPSAEVSALSGEVVFRGLENETSLTLRAGERAKFMGLYIEDQVIGYDILLKGKKVAQGQLGKVEKIPEADIKKFKKDFEEKTKKTKTAEEEIIKAKTALQICSSPNAMLNECAWICEKNPKSAKQCDYHKGAQCLRQRCNANGEWADQTILPINEAKCTAKTFVAACDY